MERFKEIERSINKTFKRSIWSKFVKGVINYSVYGDLENKPLKHNKILGDTMKKNFH